jgi:hypothetical protein
MPDEKAPSSGAFLPLSLMYFLSGKPMHFCSGVDSPVVWYGCQTHLEQYQGFVSGSNPATPTIYLIDITVFFAWF